MHRRYQEFLKNMIYLWLYLAAGLLIAISFSESGALDEVVQKIYSSRSSPISQCLLYCIAIAFLAILGPIAALAIVVNLSLYDD